MKKNTPPTKETKSRRNISISPATDEKLEWLAAKNDSNASAEITRLILQEWDKKALASVDDSDRGKSSRSGRA